MIEEKTIISTETSLITEVNILTPKKIKNLESFVIDYAFDKLEFFTKEENTQILSIKQVKKKSFDYLNFPIKIKLEKLETNNYAIYILNNDDKVLIELLGIRIKNTNSYIKPQKPSDWLYSFTYVPLKISNELKQNFSPIVFSDEFTLNDQLNIIFESRKINYLSIKKANTYKKLDDSTYQLNPVDEKTFNSFFDNIEYKNFDTLLYLWTIDKSNNKNLTEVKNKANEIYLGILNLIKTFESKNITNLKLVIVTNGVNKITDNDINISYIQSIAHALIKVAKYEYPSLELKIVDLSYDFNVDEIGVLFNELISNSKETNIAIRNEEKYYARFKPHFNSNEKYLKKLTNNKKGILSRFFQNKKDEYEEVVFSQAFKVSDKGVYLITGGLGELGLTFAKYLIEQGVKKLVLVGRSGIKNTEDQNTINELNIRAEVKIIKSDLGNEEEVKKLFENINSFGNLKGIIHSSGLINDSLLKEQTLTKFESTMNAKAYALFNLHQNTLDKELDFFIFFSSITANLGLPAHANYSSANVFIDAFAYYRKSLSLPALSINWCPWLEGGMASKYSNSDYFLANQGIIGVNRELGISIFSEAVKTNNSNISVLSLDFNKLFKAYPISLEMNVFENMIKAQKIDLSIYKEPISNNYISSNVKEAFEEIPSEKTELANLDKKEVIDTLKKEIGKILKLQVSKIDENKALVGYGFDSLMAIELVNKIEDNYKIKIKPNILKEKNTIELLSEILMTYSSVN